MIDNLLASGMIPDFLIRLGIKNLLKERIRDDIGFTCKEQENKRQAFIQKIAQAPIAIETDKANDQHYRVPPQFFMKALGKNLKYSCCHWDKANNLDEAEDEMLALTLERAEIKDGMDILELGCGWGAITLAMAKKFPNAKIVAVSNSPDQREFILNIAKERGHKNIEVITQNVAELSLERTFDRVISIEMFEHMRNYTLLLKNISNWLKPEGKLFVHIFVHKDVPYFFDGQSEGDWMSKYFFSGGIMPSEHLLYYFQEHLKVERHWRVDGTHYAKTARGWLDNMDKNKSEITKVFNEHYGEKETTKWINYWRVFFMACEELWNYKQGSEWFVGHYLLKK
jgi:cyclopropane-fatty-acyl-phospholipid synthase